MIYKADNFYLRPFKVKDITEEYLSWFHDPDVTRWNSHGRFPYTKEQAEVYWDEEIVKRDQITWAIMVPNLIKPQYRTETTETGEQATVTTYEEYFHIGNISLQSIDWINRSAEIAWLIGNKEYWGKGIATEAGKLVIEHGIERLNLHRIWCGVVEANIGMIHVAEKVDLAEEGSQCQAFMDGKEYQDVIMFGITEDIYFRLQTIMENWRKGQRNRNRHERELQKEHGSGKGEK